MAIINTAAFLAEMASAWHGTIFMATVREPNRVGRTIVQSATPQLPVMELDAATVNLDMIRGHRVVFGPASPKWLGGIVYPDQDFILLIHNWRGTEFPATGEQRGLVFHSCAKAVKELQGIRAVVVILNSGEETGLQLSDFGDVTFRNIDAN